jgi:ribulose-5-phosphate 4-epimerase/fuculose-1-phosphate aldolase
MPSASRSDRETVVRSACEMSRLGLSPGTSGNVSLRVADGFLITPSALPYGDTEPEDIVPVTGSGESLGSRRPSSEWRIHLDIYAARPDAGAVVHAHPPFSTTLACLEREIPPFHYMVAAAGGTSIRCADYATFGTQALSDFALAALDGRRACLLAHHGILALGKDLAAALQLAVEVESLAQQYWQALVITEPPLLSDSQMQEALDGFADYRPT